MDRLVYRKKPVKAERDRVSELGKNYARVRVRMSPIWPRNPSRAPTGPVKDCHWLGGVYLLISFVHTFPTSHFVTFVIIWHSCGLKILKCYSTPSTEAATSPLTTAQEQQQCAGGQPELPTAPDLYPGTNYKQGFRQSPGYFRHYLEDLPTPIWPMTLGAWYWLRAFFQGFPNAQKINLEYPCTVFTVLQVLDFNCTTRRKTWLSRTISPDCPLGILGCLLI